MTLIPTESQGCGRSKTGWRKGRWVVWESVDEGIVVLDSTKRWGYVSGDPVAETTSQTRAQERVGRGTGHWRRMIPNRWTRIGGRGWEGEWDRREKRRLTVEGRVQWVWVRTDGFT
jgi:hypothetical protein